MDPFSFAPSMDKAWTPYNLPEVRDLVSYDGQVYLQCTNCDRVLWCDPVFLSKSREDLLAAACDRCAKPGTLRFQPFRHRLRGSCSRCFQECEFDSRHPTPCNQCGGTSYSIIAVHESPPYPPTFGTALEPKGHEWCVSPADDAKKLALALRTMRHSPGFHATARHMVDFYWFLHRRAQYSKDQELRSELLNAAALLLRQLFRETGDRRTGLRALELSEKALDDVTSALDKALYRYNVAAIIYSMLAKGLETLIDLETKRSLRAEAKAHLKQALADFAGSSLNSQMREIKCAETEWLLGDVLGAGAPPSAALTESLTWYDLALSRAGLSDEMRRDIIEDSRDAKLEKLGRSPQARSGGTVQQAPQPGGDRVQTAIELDRRATDAMAAGKLDEGMEAACEAYGLVRALLASSARDTILHNYGSHFAGIAIRLAELLEPANALAVLEDFVGFAIFEHTSEKLVARKLAKIGLKDGLSQWLGAKRTVPFLRAELDAARAEAVASLTDVFSKLSGLTRVVSLAISGGSTLCIELRGADLMETHEVLDTRSTSVTKLHSSLIVLYQNNEPSGLRASRVMRVLAAMRQQLGPAAAIFEANPEERTLIVTSLFGIPFEALGMGTASINQVPKVTYSPSVSIVAAMVGVQGRGVKTLLGIGYNGSDLPDVPKELAAVAAVVGGDAELLAGARLRKGEVLASLTAKEWDVIHFAGHGVYDAIDPLDSHMILNHPQRSEEDRVTARDLLSVRSLPGRPLVFLSACSSGVVSANGSGNCLGLVGALLRLGVRGIVGTRWPVSDEVARDYAAAFYDALVQGAVPGEAAARAQRELRRQGKPLDDWCAFIFIGP